MIARARRVLLLLGIGLMSTPLSAVDRLALDIGAWAGRGMSASGIKLELAMPPPGAGPLRMTIANADLGPQLGRATKLVVECAMPRLEASRYRCDHALLTGTFERFGAQSIDARFSWVTSPQALEFSASGLRFAGGSVALSGAWKVGEWSVDVIAAGISVAALRQALTTALPAHTPLPIPTAWSLDGRLDRLHVVLASTDSLQRLRLEGVIERLNFADPDGTTAGQQLAAQVVLRAARARGAWQFEGSLTQRAGELLAGRAYWNFGPQPLAAEVAGQWSDAAQLTLDRLHLSIGTLLSADASGLWDASALLHLRRASVRITDFDLAALPAPTRAGLLLGSPVPQLAGLGHAHGQVDIADDSLAAIDLTMTEVALADSGNGLGIEGLDGRVLWQAAAPAAPAELRWRKGTLYGVAIGPSAIRFTAGGSDFTLLEPVRVPILDGGLKITTLQLQSAGATDMSLRFAADLEPISMQGLCEAFGWPVFGGTLSGPIPQLNLDKGILTLGGALQAKVFDGLITVSGLTVSDVLGTRPRLEADIVIDNLDLEAVTGAFSFGAITGRLSGRIDELQLVDWEPTAFDAIFHTPLHDTSRRRISQRAVENMSSLGGGAGASAALQRGALRFFKDFSYQKLGLSCRLRNDVCTMDGIEPHPRGYYLVKGSGIPRIDVIGDSHRVDWPGMVASLKELSKSHATIGSP